MNAFSSWMLICITFAFLWLVIGRPYVKRNHNED